MTRIRGVLFDFDGTLVDTWRLYIETYRRTLNEILGQSYTGTEVEELRPKAEIRFFLDEPYRAQYDALYETFVRYYDEHHANHFDGPYPGALEAARAVVERGYDTAVVTGKSRSAYESTMRVLDADGLIGSLVFDTSVCDDDVNRPKPDPEGILLACRRLGLKGEEIVYAGDSSVDIDATMEVGGVFVGALWAKNAGERQEFRQICADHAAAYPERVHLLEEPGEMLTLLADIGEH